MIHLRAEQDGDRPAIYDVVSRAFGRTEEARLVDRIRERGNARLATVAVIEDAVEGYVLASPIVLEPDCSLSCLGIAPLAVAPDLHGGGAGSALMHHIIEAARQSSNDALFLLGHPGYYPRFGFAPTHIGNEYGATDGFMALELRQGCLEGHVATAKFVPEFAAADN